MIIWEIWVNVFSEFPSSSVPLTQRVSSLRSGQVVEVPLPIAFIPPCLPGFAVPLHFCLRLRFDAKPRFNFSPYARGGSVRRLKPM